MAIDTKEATLTESHTATVDTNGQMEATTKASSLAAIEMEKASFTNLMVQRTKVIIWLHK